MNTKEEQMRERDYIVMEAARIDSTERYFNARPQIDTADRRKVFESGFERGYQARQAALNSLEGKSEAEGWKLVPIEPTKKMIEASFTCEPGDISGCKTLREISSVTVPNFYKAMLAAAPQPPEDDCRCSACSYEGKHEVDTDCPMCRTGHMMKQPPKAEDRVRELETARKALEEIASPSQSTNLLWWQVKARDALAAMKEPNTLEGDWIEHKSSLTTAT